MTNSGRRKKKPCLCSRVRRFVVKMSESETKWACEYCTYENYPSSLKCTMCRGPKPFFSEDIYRLHGEKAINDDMFGSAAGPIENKPKSKYTFLLRSF